jgi:hypothetical protein
MAVTATSDAEFNLATPHDNFSTADTAPKRHAACDECSESGQHEHFFRKLTQYCGSRKTKTEMFWGAHGLSSMYQAIPLLSLLDTKADGPSSEEAYAGKRCYQFNRL